MSQMMHGCHNFTRGNCSSHCPGENGPSWPQSGAVNSDLRPVSRSRPIRMSAERHQLHLFNGSTTTKLLLKADGGVIRVLVCVRSQPSAAPTFSCTNPESILTLFLSTLTQIQINVFFHHAVESIIVLFICVCLSGELHLRG